jgi:hypothetical protein
VALRREVIIRSGGEDGGVQVEATRKGITAFGWIGAFQCGNPVVITWEELDAMRKEIRKAKPKPLQKESLFDG